jgi:hypothetical protein
VPEDIASAKAKAAIKQSSTGGHRRNRGFAARLLIGLSTSVCILLFQNCGTDFVPMSDEDLASFGTFICSATDAENFGKTYKTFARNHCAGCHGTTQSPKFAIADTALGFQEFSKTTQDTFLEYGSNQSHGGGAGGEELTGQIIEAQTRFNSCKNGGIATGNDTVTARTVPLTLAATATIGLRTFATLDTQLEVGATNLGGARLHFQVRVDTTQAVPLYVIARPSLQTGTATVAVKNITIKINGIKIPAATAFMAVDKVINPNTNPVNNNVPNGNLSLGSAAFEFPNAAPATDTIQFEFELLRAQ